MRHFIVAMILVSVAALPARAQSSLLGSCAEQSIEGVPTTINDAFAPQFQQLCAQVVNSLTTVQPSVGIAFSGGNPVLGTGSTLGTRIGSIPRVSLTARANFAFVDVPSLFDGYNAVLDGPNSQLPEMGTTGLPVASLQGDISIGVFNGLSLTPLISGIGSVDLLGSVAFLPKIEDVGISDAIVNYGAGARIGLLRQGIVAPGASVSVMYRRMGESGFGSLDRDAGAFSTNLSTLSVRGVVSKGLPLLDFAVGAGYDSYSSDIELGWEIECRASDCLSVGQGSPLPLRGTLEGQLETAAWNVFGNATFDLIILKIVGEVGYQKAMDLIDTDDLSEAGLPANPLTSDDLSGGRIFGSVGLRIAL